MALAAKATAADWLVLVMSGVDILSERIDNDLDRYGWAQSEDERRKALLTWMHTISSALVTLANRGDAADELEAKLIEKGVL
jgi:hypothetical protein